MNLKKILRFAKKVAPVVVANAPVILAGVAAGKEIVKEVKNTKKPTA
ncbi:hypothetical protein IC614_03120 [Allosphingosinicella flava]|uniref:Uncharacterized protein n=1 Tax=Allosphingosinicella flava TaxID=2771430 RepID=A0A7T2GL99_9SPHN|nr:hypothetical protein [Sphingosinicella flava]QPQ55608.1 hypothetical protein IC614_03120 [Sphingosinicella flava]